MRKAALLFLACLMASVMWAQQDNQQQGQPPHPRDHMGMMGPGGPGGPGFGIPPGPWWKNSQIAQKLNLTDAQVQQIESAFQQNRSNLQAANQALRQAEEAFKPLIDSDQLNDAQINAQLDAVLQARANLERLHAQTLLAIRKVLTHDQWTALQSMEPARGMMRPRGFGKNQQNGQQPPPPPEE